MTSPVALARIDAGEAVARWRLMKRFLLHRAVIAVPSLVGVTIVVFVTLKLIPGNPVAAIAGVNSTPAERTALTHQLTLRSSSPCTAG